MKNLTLEFDSFPAHKSVIELTVVGRGKLAYLWVGIRPAGEGLSRSRPAGAINNGAKLRKFLDRATKRMRTK